MEPFVLTCQIGKHAYRFSDVLRIESVGNYSRIYFTGDKRPLLVAKVLSHFEGTLPTCTFMRVHRSHLVNKLYIKEVVDCKQSGLQIYLVNGEVIGVSRRKKAAFKKSHEENLKNPILPLPLFRISNS